MSGVDLFYKGMQAPDLNIHQFPRLCLHAARASSASACSAREALSASVRACNGSAQLGSGRLCQQPEHTTMFCLLSEGCYNAAGLGSH